MAWKADLPCPVWDWVWARALVTPVVDRSLILRKWAAAGASRAPPTNSTTMPRALVMPLRLMVPGMTRVLRRPTR